MRVVKRVENPELVESIDVVVEVKPTAYGNANLHDPALEKLTYIETKIRWIDHSGQLVGDGAGVLEQLDFGGLMCVEPALRAVDLRLGMSESVVVDCDAEYRAVPLPLGHKYLSLISRSYDY